VRGGKTGRRFSASPMQDFLPESTFGWGRGRGAVRRGLRSRFEEGGRMARLTSLGNKLVTEQDIGKSNLSQKKKQLIEMGKEGGGLFKKKVTVEPGGVTREGGEKRKKS